jgi:hypothetical protein
MIPPLQPPTPTPGEAAICCGPHGTNRGPLLLLGRGRAGGVPVRCTCGCTCRGAVAIRSMPSSTEVPSSFSAALCRRPPRSPRSYRACTCLAATVLPMLPGGARKYWCGTHENTSSGSSTGSLSYLGGRAWAERGQSIGRAVTRRDLATAGEWPRDRWIAGGEQGCSRDHGGCAPHTPLCTRCARELLSSLLSSTCRQLAPTEAERSAAA